MDETTGTQPEFGDFWTDYYLLFGEDEAREFRDKFISLAVMKYFGLPCEFEKELSDMIKKYDDFKRPT